MIEMTLRKTHYHEIDEARGETREKELERVERK